MPAPSGMAAVRCATTSSLSAALGVPKETCSNPRLHRRSLTLAINRHTLLTSTSFHYLPSTEVIYILAHAMHDISDKTPPCWLCFKHTVWLEQTEGSTLRDLVVS